MPTNRRKKPPPQTTSDYLSTLENAIRQLSYGQHVFTVFRHFVELSAITLSNVADPINHAARKAPYLCHREARWRPGDSCYAQKSLATRSQ